MVKPRLFDLKLKELLDDIFIILSDKEKTVVTKRFALDNNDKQTLESIGKKFSVTRERVRQIETSALKKLKRNIPNTQLNIVSTKILEIMQEYGNVLSEEKIISKVLSNIHHTSPTDGQIIRLSLTVNAKLKKIEMPKQFKIFWCWNDISLEKIKKIANTSYRILKKTGDILGEKVLIRSINDIFKEEISPPTILSILDVDLRFKNINQTKWGLAEWRHVNPKSIRDKANIVLKKNTKPLHFIDIANKIASANFDRKTVTVQAVHNDLIRYPEFVLVGRGLYALAEWGFENGTVADVIADILKKEGPLSKKEIVAKVLEKRNVKVGTISLNLQKIKAFSRVGRAVYQFEPAKWSEKESGRGRGRKKD